MLLFGHVGITLGLVYLLAAPWGGRRRVDYRLVMAGALLSDIIDKPLGIALGIYGRNVGHTLLFPSLLTLVLALPLILPHRLPRVLAARLGNPVIYLAPGVWSHLILDRMWGYQAVLLWPGFGLAFPPSTLDPLDVLAFLTDAYTLAGEAVGLTTLLAVARRHGLIHLDRLRVFLRDGRLGP